MALRTAALAAKPILSSDPPTSQDDENDAIPSLLLPPPIMPFRIYGHNYLVGTHLIQLTMGHPSGILQGVTPPAAIRLHPHTSENIKQRWIDQPVATKLVVRCKTDMVAAPLAVDLPIEGEKNDVAFQLASLDHLLLEFSLYPIFGSKIIGRAILLPSAFKSIKTRARYIAPLLDHHLHVIGEIAFEVCIISPFNRITLEVGGAVETYWKSAATPFASGLSKSSLRSTSSALKSVNASPLHNQPLTSFNEASIASSSVVGNFLKLTVQVTRDKIPVVYSNWQLPVQDLRVGIVDVTVDQFKKLGSPAASLAIPTTECIASWSEYLTRVPSTLQAALELLPAEIGLFIDVVLVTASMKESLGLGNSHRLNEAVDCILDVVYASTYPTGGVEDKSYTARRKIMLSSFHPDVCSALNWKQPNYPVTFASFCGINDSVPSLSSHADNRCSSVANVLDFARKNNLLSIAVPLSLLLQVPSLVPGIKDCGVILLALDGENERKPTDERSKLHTDGLDGEISNAVVTFFESQR